MKKKMINNIYFRDLACRQNQPITEAQIHLYENAKRYYNKDIRRCFKEMTEKKQVDLIGNKVDELNINNNNIQEEYEKKIEDKIIERLFVYQRKIVMVDNKSILKIKYKNILFDELIDELTKIYDWLDNRGAYLKFTDDTEKEHVIDKSEIATVIHFFDKLNKIKKD